MIKLIGICILLFTSMLISGELVSRRRHRLVLCEELLRFVSYIRLQIGCFLRPIPEVVGSFCSDEFNKCGFLPEVSDADLAACFLSSDVPKLVGTECSRIMESLFSSLGTGYLEDEIKLIDVHRAQLTELVERERAETVRQVRLIRTLAGSASLGLVIFII